MNLGHFRIVDQFALLDESLGRGLDEVRQRAITERAKKRGRSVDFIELARPNHLAQSDKTRKIYGLAPFLQYL